MNTIVIFNSKTGFTEKYAGWIAEELHCEAVPYKKITSAQLAQAQLIIFGGGLMAGKIPGLDKLKSSFTASQKLILFVTGATPQHSTEVIEKIKNDNLTPEEQKTIPFFYFEGGINFERMGFFGKMILKTLRSSLSKKESRTPEEEEMLHAFCQHDSSDRSYIAPLVKLVTDMEQDTVSPS